MKRLAGTRRTNDRSINQRKLRSAKFGVERDVLRDGHAWPPPTANDGMPALRSAAHRRPTTG
eukprot:4666450-Prymnesium_polylepis.1